MVNIYRGEVGITLDKKSYVMVPSFQVLVNIEDELNCSILDLVNKISNATHLSLQEMETIIRCSIREELPELGRLIYSAGIINILPKVIKFIENAIGGNYGTTK